MLRAVAADRQLDLRKPENATKAREALLGIIERATERLTLKADAHRQRDEVQAELAADVLAFMIARRASACVATSWHTDGAWPARSTYSKSTAALPTQSIQVSRTAQSLNSTSNNKPTR